ncbi:MAG: hypothetical protein M0C28_33415 [Candidatus Moduliflexus flocculans]|nr:hypothetical protein [Candidatus Moduliflexus flocculans]
MCVWVSRPEGQSATAADPQPGQAAPARSDAIRILRNIASGLDLILIARPPLVTASLARYPRRH